MRSLIALLLVFVVASVAASAPTNEDITARLQSLQQQLASLQQAYSDRSSEIPAQPMNDISPRFSPFIPQKRMVAWQPMKRSEVDRETMFRAIESRLLEVLAAGERLGISPQEVLDHLREKNTNRGL